MANTVKSVQLNFIFGAARLLKPWVRSSLTPCDLSPVSVQVFHSHNRPHWNSLRLSWPRCPLGNHIQQQFLWHSASNPAQTESLYLLEAEHSPSVSGPPLLSRPEPEPRAFDRAQEVRLMGGPRRRWELHWESQKRGWIFNIGHVARLDLLPVTLTDASTPTAARNRPHAAVQQDVFLLRLLSVTTRCGQRHLTTFTSCASLYYMCHISNLSCLRPPLYILRHGNFCDCEGNGLPRKFCCCSWNWIVGFMTFSLPSKCCTQCRVFLVFCLFFNPSSLVHTHTHYSGIEKHMQRVFSSPSILSFTLNITVSSNIFNRNVSYCILGSVAVPNRAWKLIPGFGGEKDKTAN